MGERPTRPLRGSCGGFSTKMKIGRQGFLWKESSGAESQHRKSQDRNATTVRGTSYGAIGRCCLNLPGSEASVQLGRAPR
jgi:hypothetical protein